MGRRDHVFKLQVGTEKAVMLAASDRTSLEDWKNALRNLIDIYKTKPQDLRLN